MSHANIHSLFYPKSIAVIGASSEKDTVAYTVFRNIFESGFKGKVYPVNPNHPTVQGKKAFKSVLDIPKTVDQAIIVVPARFVPLVAQQCVDKKVKAVTIISAGFSEIGEKKLTAQLQSVMNKTKYTRFLGPNCFGVFSPKVLNTTFSDKHRMKFPKKGTVSFISQSGALGVTILDWMHTQEFGLSTFISYGNAMDIDESDLLEFLGQDAKTKVATMYIEGAKRGRKFFQIAKRVARKMPVIALKGGVTEETHKATASHTGSLAGSSAVYRGLFKQTGIVQADSLEELFMFAKLFENEPLPKGNRTLVVSNGGGYAIITADQLIQAGLSLSKMEGKTKKYLRKQMPPTVNIRNPLDVVGDADYKRYKIAIEAGLKDKNVDIVVVLVLFNTPTMNERVVKELISIRKKAKKPMVVISTGSQFTKDMLQLLEKGGVVTFEYPGIAAHALAALHQYARFKK